MKAIVKTSHAPGAAYRDAEVPAINKDELLIRVTSASLSSGDLAAYNWTDPLFPAHRLPFVFGQEFCGEVVETGSLARGFEKGDFVSVESHIFCGVCGQCRNDQRHICQYLRVIGRDTPGGLAEYAAVPARCAWKHTDDSLKDIGALMGAFGSSVHAVLAEDIVGRSIVVSGCAPQGLFAAGIARAGGARKIIALDPSPYRRRLALKMGAGAAIDPADRNCLKKIARTCGAEGADTVVEMSGGAAAVELGLKALRPGGRFVAFGLPLTNLSIDYAGDIVRRGIRLEGVAGREIFRSWYKMESLLKSGAVDPRPAITHTFRFKDFRKAFDLINSKEQKCGKVILVP
ncbi:MAG: alcohol dehydrogenase catalytic domain-containing protein [Elusimicrobia bacterium]|nr:alcohol dehydrogenase catalytic domain-containing protein [Elusimicrobiota bacterium]